MAQFEARLDLRVSVAQRAQLLELAERIGLPPMAIVRSLLDGVGNIDGCELLPTLFRFSQADPDNLHELPLVIKLLDGTVPDGPIHAVTR
jgi:hypothetical protein